MDIKIGTSTVTQTLLDKNNAELLAAREQKDSTSTSKDLGFRVVSYCKKDMHNGKVLQMVYKVELVKSQVDQLLNEMLKAMLTDNNDIVSKRGSNDIVKQLNQILAFCESKNMH